MSNRFFRSIIAVPLAALMAFGPSTAIAGGGGGFSFGGGFGGFGGGYGGYSGGHGSGHGGSNWGDWGSILGNDWGSGSGHRSPPRRIAPRSNTVRRHTTPRSNSVTKSKKPKSNSLPKTAKSAKPRSNSLPQTAGKSTKGKPLANVAPVKKIKPIENATPLMRTVSFTPEHADAWLRQTRNRLDKHARALEQGKPTEEQIEELLPPDKLSPEDRETIEDLVQEGNVEELKEFLGAADKGLSKDTANSLESMAHAVAWIDAIVGNARRGTLSLEQLRAAAAALRKAGLLDPLASALANLALNTQLAKILSTARPGDNPVPRGPAVNVALRGLPPGKVIPLGNGAVLTGARTGSLPTGGANGTVASANDPAGTTAAGPGRGINPALEGGGRGQPMGAVTGGGAGGNPPDGRRIGNMAGGGAVPGAAQVAVGVQVTNVNIQGGPVFNGPGGPPFGPWGPGPFWGGGPPFFPGPFFGGPGFGPPLDMFIDVGDPWDVAGIDMPIGPPAPDAEDVPAGDGVVLRNAGDSTINYLVNENDFSMQPRYSQDLPGGRSWVVSFDRGGSFGTARYTLTEGTYYFTPTDRGWELYNKTFEAVIDNGESDQAFSYVWKNEQQSMEAGEAKEHTDIYPLIVKFDDGKGGTKERRLESGTYKVSTSPDDGSLDLYPASSFEAPEPATVAARSRRSEVAESAGPSRPRLVASIEEELPRGPIPNLFGEVTTSADILNLFAADTDDDEVDFAPPDEAVRRGRSAVR